MKTLIKKIINSAGFEIKRKSSRGTYPVELNDKDIQIIDYIMSKNITMIGLPRLIANVMSAKYVIKNKLEGDFLECGVWRGGSTLAVKMIFEEYHWDAKVWLFDTFKGMTKPNKFDNLHNGENAKIHYDKFDKGDYNAWCYASVEDVKQVFMEAKVNMNQCEFIKGDVMKTLPQHIDKIKHLSLLRLDTDWYESTKIEIEMLYPKLVSKGILIIDDFGFWEGARKAIEEYFDQQNHYPYLHHIDHSGRICLKI